MGEGEDWGNTQGHTGTIFMVRETSAGVPVITEHDACPLSIALLLPMSTPTNCPFK